MTDSKNLCSFNFLTLQALNFPGLNAFDDEAADGAMSTADGEGDVQKKIMPWKQMVPDDETAQEINFGVKQQIEEGLVVVTSLITKIPNLGGKTLGSAH